MKPTRPETTAEQSFFRLDKDRQRHAFEARHLFKLILSYAPDWILTIVATGLFFLVGNIDPFKREFSLSDTSIQHTFAVKERIDNTHLVLICFVAPLVIMPLINLISIRSFWDWHVSWLGAILALGITGTVTNIVKVTVGRPRPDCIDRCQPTAGAANGAVFGLVNSTICTQTDQSILRDGFRSFPSGHSSLSFAGLGFLFFYLAGKLHLFDKRGYTLKAWISVIPLAGAALVAVSRTMDYRHHWQDVLVGSILGFTLAWFSYRQYFPPLTDRLSHRPYSPRINHIRAPLVPQFVEGDSRANSPNEQYEMQGEQQSKQGAPTLMEMWHEGQGEEILPQGEQQHSRPLLGDERV